MSSDKTAGIIIGYTMVVVVFTLMVIHLIEQHAYWGVIGLILCAGWLVAIFVGIMSED